MKTIILTFLILSAIVYGQNKFLAREHKTPELFKLISESVSPMNGNNSNSSNSSNSTNSSTLRFTYYQKKEKNFLSRPSAFLTSIESVSTFKPLTHALPEVGGM